MKRRQTVELFEYDPVKHTDGKTGEVYLENGKVSGDGSKAAKFVLSRSVPNPRGGRITKEDDARAWFEALAYTYTGTMFRASLPK